MSNNPMTLFFRTNLQINVRVRRFVAATALPLAALVLAAPLGAQEKTGPDKTASASSAVFAPAEIKSEIAYLASDELRGRGSGEPGNDRAAQYVAREFAKDGLKPLGTNKQRDPNATLDQSGYFQPFTFVAGRVVGSNNRLKFWYGGGDHPKMTFAAGYYAPSSVSAASNPGTTMRVQGQIVFAGYGIQAPKAGHNDYANISVKGKVVMMLAGSPKDDPHSPLADYADIYRKAAAARDLGAAAVLVVLPKSANTLQTSRTGFDSTEDAGIPVMRVRREIADTLLDLPPQTLADVQQRADAGANVTFAFPAAQTLQIQTDVHKVEKVTANVVGVIEGSDPVLKNEYVVIGAHLDHLGMAGRVRLPHRKPLPSITARTTTPAARRA